MPTYHMYVIDNPSSGPIRFKYRMEISQDDSGWGQQVCRWRQLPPYNRQYFKTGGGCWSAITPKGGKVMRTTTAMSKAVVFYDREGEEGAGMSLVLYDVTRNGAVVQNTQFPAAGLYGPGVLAESMPGMSSQGVLDLMNRGGNCTWLLTEEMYDPPDPRYVWLGAAFKYDGQLAIYGKENAYGFFQNVADSSKGFYFVTDADRWGAGLGASCTLALVVATGENPGALFNTTSSGPDFSLALAGSWGGPLRVILKGKWAMLRPLMASYDTLLKGAGKYQSAMQRVAAIHKSLPAILKTAEYETGANTIKTLCGALGGIDWRSPGLTMMDIPFAGVGMEIAATWTTVKVASVVRM